ncbi:rhodanese-like domain-containing protein [Cytobacillus firmus]|nr:rhodanese-like domain-containing protein [Cytobacillus firmus]
MAALVNANCYIKSFPERVLKLNRIEEITTEELQKKLEAGEKLELVDVREDEEVAAGMIPGARHIRMGTIPENLDKFDKDTEYIIICRSGGRSGNVCHYLQEQGYKVRNMAGGMLDWQGKTE